MDKDTVEQSKIQAAWEGTKGFVGILLLAIVLVGIGMQIQSWMNAQERAQLRKQYTDDLQQARLEYDKKATTRTDIVDEVKRVTEETLRIQHETLAIVQRIVPQTEEMSKTVKRVDRKAGDAARESRKARVAADNAAEAIQENIDAESLNEKIRMVNRRGK